QQGEAVRHEHVTTVRTIDQPIDQRAGRHEVHRVAGHADAGAEEVVARVEVPEPELAVPDTLDQPAAATLHSRPVVHAYHAVAAPNSTAVTRKPRAKPTGSAGVWSSTQRRATAGYVKVCSMRPASRPRHRPVSPNARVSGIARLTVSTAAAALITTRSHDCSAASMMYASDRMNAVCTAIRTINRSTSLPASWLAATH